MADTARASAKVRTRTKPARKGAATTPPMPAPAPGVRSIFTAGSPVVVTAWELATTHASADGAQGACPRCGMPAPCPTGTHAVQVCQAAGLSVGLGIEHETGVP